MSAAMLRFNKEPVEIHRAKHLSSEVFNQRYRNRHPVILSQIISDWLPTTKWTTTSYLQKALEHQFQDGLQVFVSRDNRQFINHPEVTTTITCAPEDFLSRVFNGQDGCDIRNPSTASDDEDGQIERQRYYLRTFSMPEVLFGDINVPSQIKALLDVICYIKYEDFLNQKGLLSQDASGDNAGHCPVHDSASARDEEIVSPSSPWEEMLSAPCSCVSSCNDDSSLGPRTEQNYTPIKSTSFRARDATQPSASSESSERRDAVVDAVQKSGHGHGNKSVASECQDMHARIFNQSTMQLWIGTRGNVTPLHYDRNHGLLAQIVGRKELVLFSHEDTHNVYPRASYSERAHTSRVDLHTSDVEDDKRFPKLRNAQPYHCVLQPGELLYTPPFWWHDVTSLDNCISVTLPWDMSSNEDAPVCMFM